jgi:hypothetical protein
MSGDWETERRNPFEGVVVSEFPVPPATPELVLILAGLEADRKSRGNEWCRKHGIGARRAVLGPSLPPNVVKLNTGARHPDEIRALTAAEMARNTLAAHCRKCGGCPWSKA